MGPQKARLQNRLAQQVNHLKNKTLPVFCRFHLIRCSGVMSESFVIVYFCALSCSILLYLYHRLTYLDVNRWWQGETFDKEVFLCFYLFLVHFKLVGGGTLYIKQASCNLYLSVHTNTPIVISDCVKYKAADSSGTTVLRAVSSFWCTCSLWMILYFTNPPDNDTLCLPCIMPLGVYSATWAAMFMVMVHDHFLWKTTPVYDTDSMNG